MIKLAWSAIVRDESARIARCVRSLLPHIDCGIVVDTGSTDGTQDLISKLFQEADKPVEIFSAPFVDFSQARNEALRRARASKLEWEYALLVDADMELAVIDPNWTQKLNGGLAYDMQQKAGGLNYWNKRVIARHATGEYRGVTHEYLDIPSSGQINGSFFIDHADGANRPGKIERDIELLTRALETETFPGLVQRYHFYLAQSYFDLHEWAKALEHYKKRIELGGWIEEVWYAQLRLAHCQNNLGNHPGFVWNLLQAYAMRPGRTETLYDLAKFFRERGDPYSSLLFSEPGMAAKPSDDVLFVRDVRELLREEFSICAYYDERRRRTGGKEANKLALAGSEQARSNLFWYLQPLQEEVRSFKPQQIEFTPPDGYVPMNPSVINHDGKPLILVRTVNYTITPEGQYQIRSSDGSLGGDHPIHTRNFIGPVGGPWREIALPANWPNSNFSLVLGLEDSRLFEWHGEHWTLSTCREATSQGWCEQVLASIQCDGDRRQYGTDWRSILPKDRRHEKNWMPWVRDDGELVFVYRLGTLINSKGEVVFEQKPKWEVGHVSGGSQVVKLDDRTWLALVHEARTVPGRPNRYYQHRFVAFDRHGKVDGLSAPFFFADRQIEFAAGLAYFPEKNQLMASYGVRDCEAWTATMDVGEVMQFIYKDAL